jgi:hypothetical protein
MRRYRFVPLTLLLITLVSMPVAARTTTLLNASDDTSECPDLSAEVAGGQADTAAKPAAAKAGAVPAAGKSRPAVRGNGTAPVRAPRWHRFIPGMFR